MTTLEKLCRAACEANGGPRFIDPELIAQASAPYRGIVLAILSALEDPSDEMVKAGADVEMRSLCEGDPTAFVPDVPAIFTAMIRKAQSQ